MRFLLLLLVSIAAATGILIYVQPSLVNTAREAIQPGSTPASLGMDTDGIMFTRLAKPAQNELSFLFVGNSFTFTGDMPQMIEHIAESDALNTTNYRIKVVAKGGTGLNERWDDGEAAASIRKDKWNYVILQNYSFWVASQDLIDIAYRATLEFNQIIRAAGSQPLLFSTWADQEGSHEYGSNHVFANGEQMQNALTPLTHKLGKIIGAPVVDVGEYWRMALRASPTAPLFGPDHHHPSREGAYLTALVFYHYFSGHDVQKITYVPPGMLESTAVWLRYIAMQPLVAR